MIRNLEHTFATTAWATGRDIRQSFVMRGAMCLCLDDMNYQPKPNGTDRSLQPD